MSSFAGWHMLDMFFLALGCYFVIRGMFRGIIGEVLSLGGLVLSVYVGFRHSGALGRVIVSVSGVNKEIAQVLAVVVVWLAVTLIFAILRRILKKGVELASLGALDRVLGILCGALKTGIVVYAVLIGGILMSPVVEPTWMADSSALIYAGRKWPQVRSFMIDMKMLPRDTVLPNGTLEQMLRPYRRGSGAPGTLGGGARTLLRAGETEGRRRV